VVWAAWITNPKQQHELQQPDSQESGCFALKIFSSDNFGFRRRITSNRESTAPFDGFGLGSHTRNCVIWM
jgi:nicotinic acid phosphoribosyltransferase